MIRNVNKTETGGFTYLRINFMTPDMAFNASQKLSVRPSAAVPVVICLLSNSTRILVPLHTQAAISPNQFFVQELTFRSKSKSLDSGRWT